MIGSGFRWSRGLRTIAWFVFALFGAGFFWFASQVNTVEAPLVRKADGMVVLTGGAERVTDAIRLLMAGHARRLLITGVSSGTTAQEIARSVQGSAETVRCCVDLGYSAQNTAGNAEETSRWVREKNIRASLIVVTSSYHMRRALAEMRLRLPHLELVPHAVVADRLRGKLWWNDAELFRLVGTEYLKFLWSEARVLASGKGPT
jgi:uncharacterized SAM-binding protein YcdF (DUF218 family)